VFRTLLNSPYPHKFHIYNHASALHIPYRLIVWDLEFD
jgi:hypothetical protein